MKTINSTFSTFFLILLIGINNSTIAQLPKEQALWPGGIPHNPVKYNQEKVRAHSSNRISTLQQNRVFSQVSVPTYLLFQPENETANGVAVVICPGGGFRDVWLDREGVQIARWFARKGITSLVLKYRTFNPDSEGFSLTRDVYNTEVYADAKQAIAVLRSRADELKIDKNKIGIGGFSAGGALALYEALNIFESTLPDYAQFKEDTKPNFVFPIYPGINNAIYQMVKHKENIQPMFLVNGAEDTVTPADKCIQLYTALLKRNIPAELHIYAKGNHGFDSGIGRGKGVASWQNSFINWLKDLGFIE